MLTNFEWLKSDKMRWLVLHVSIIIIAMKKKTLNVVLIFFFIQIEVLLQSPEVLIVIMAW